MHYLICGSTGSGKSQTMLGILLAAALSKCSILLLDPHGSLARAFLRLLLFHGLMNRVRFDDYGKLDKTLAISSLRASRETDPWKQAQENTQTINEWKQNVLYLRGKQDATQNPIIDARLDLVGNLFLYQDRPAEEYWLAGALDFTTDQSRHLKAHCVREDVVSELDRLEHLPRTLQNSEVAPVDRILKKHYMTPAIVARLRADRFDDWLDDGVIVVDDASGTDYETRRALMGKKLLRFMSKAKKGCKRRMILCLEESETSGLANLHTPQFLAESRKWGVDAYLLVQNPLTFHTEEIRDGIWQNTAHIFHRQASPNCADVAAEEVATMLFDPMKVHHREYTIQQLHDGYQKIDADRTSVTKDKHGKTISKGEQDADQYLARYKQRENMRTYYKDFNTQKHEIKQQLMMLSPGWAWIVNDKVTPEPVYIPMKEEPQSWSLSFSRELTLGDKKLRDALQQLYQHPDYQPPQLLRPS